MIAWNIISLRAYNNYENTNDVIKTVVWSITKTIDNKRESMMGSTDLTIVPPFISYTNLTEETVLQWLFDKMGQKEKLEIEAGLSKAFDERHYPEIVTKPLPWE